jgi:hypothetical protein
MLALNLSLVVVAYVVGLFAPGYLCARLFGARQPWLTALPISMLVLLLGALALDAAGVPLRFGTMLGWVGPVSAVLAVLNWKLRPHGAITAVPVRPTGESSADRWPAHLLAGGIALLALLAIARAVMTPLMGPDTLFRWEFLARQVLRVQSLGFYPPVTAEDFRVYFFADGFAPLISISYWWIYAAVGGPWQEALAPLVALQYIASLAIVFELGHRLHSRRAGLVAAAILAATPLFFRAVLIGQETGLTALATIGTVLILVETDPPHAVRGALLAGIVAAAAGSAREYAPAFVVCGVAVIAWRRLGWRALAVFVVTAAVLLAPWHARNWLHSGSPLYGHSLGWFRANAVFEGMMQSYPASFGLRNYSRGEALEGLRQLAVVAGLPLLLGLPAAIWQWRRHGFLLVGAALSIALWLVSIGYTSGGWPYALRVLSPALALLAVAAGVGLTQLTGGRTWRWPFALGLLVALAHGAVWAGIFPDYPDQAGRRGAWRSLTQHGHLSVMESGLENDLPAVLPAGTRILSDNAYVHCLLATAGRPYDVVPIWSPEVAFLFDRSLDPLEQRRRLLARSINVVFLYPNSANTQFCIGRSPFYARDRSQWRIVGRFKDLFYICELPRP